MYDIETLSINTLTQKQQIFIVYYDFFTRKSTYQVPCIWQGSSAFHVYPENPRTYSLQCPTFYKTRKHG